MLLSSGRHPNDVGGGLFWAPAIVGGSRWVVAAWVRASWCWVWLDWGGGLKEWLAPGMTWRVARGVGAVWTGGVGRHGPGDGLRTSARLIPS